MEPAAITWLTITIAVLVLGCYGIKEGNNDLLELLGILGLVLGGISLLLFVIAPVFGEYKAYNVSEVMRSLKGTTVEIVTEDSDGNPVKNVIYDNTVEIWVAKPEELEAINEIRMSAVGITDASVWRLRKKGIVQKPIEPIKATELVEGENTSSP